MCLALIACSSISASAETAIGFVENTTIYGDVTGDGTVEKTVKVKIDVANNPGMALSGISVNYDKTANGTLVTLTFEIN